MARDKPRPPVAKLHELAVGPPASDFFALLVEKKKGTTRDGKPFYSCRFRDHRRTVSCVIWADAPLYTECEQNWHAGMIYKVRGVFAEHEKYGPQIEVVRLRESTTADKEDGLNEAEFIERSRFDSDAMFTDLKALVQAEIRDEPLKVLIDGLLDAHAEPLKKLPATARHFYPFPGGWLEHVLNVTRNCCWLADQYAERFPDLKPFNRDLVVAGAVLHDIGRVAEYTITLPTLPPESTVAGHLFGHIQLSRDLVRDAAKGVEGLNAELVQLLEHVILAHLTRPEWGSPRLPMIPEVLILHHADDLDAKFEMFARHLTRDTGEGLVTERDPILNKQLLKQRSV
ncbi:3'-5' exoribonuclease YhaM family protein [Limnoglobus roseus]|uniref:HD domain-containing protein n=1 Tax=Limnoglobus roseus TaxID=2598579 RepID=A0A5C1AN40_9BACT|nr:HD domain-containing protein [Limnoglobus roseus]QEL19406.1 HD domain-containing protein [Limnoglobus roseus]